MLLDCIYIQLTRFDINSLFWIFYSIFCYYLTIINKKLNLTKDLLNILRQKSSQERINSSIGRLISQTEIIEITLADISLGKKQEFYYI